MAKRGRPRLFSTPYRKLYTNYRHSAKVRGYDFHIDQEFFDDMVMEPCHYCGTDEAYGIDRKDNDVGYVESNCLPCCATCNRAKGTLTYKQFKKYIRRLQGWQK